MYQTPSYFAHFALIAWLPAVLVMFIVFKPRRAIITAFVVGWLFLPIYGYDLPGLPDYSKISATNFGVLIGALLFDFNRVLRFRPRWFDLPMLAWVLLPFFSAITNTDPTGPRPGLDAYEGLAVIADQAIVWGIPYFIGRAYFNDLAALRELAIGIVVGAIVYIPFCIFEMRMSPVLHLWIYGFHQTPAWRIYGGVFELLLLGQQPRVFMINALALTMWMAGCALLAFWLAWTRSVRSIFGFPMWYWALLLLAVSILCKSMGPNVLAFMGIGVLVLTRFVPTRLFVVGLLIITPAYITLRAADLWHGEPVMSIAEAISPTRASSLQTRLDNEDSLVDRAMERPLFGWGRFGRNRIIDESGKDVTLADGLWVIVLGQFGIAGLAALTSMMLLPMVMFIRKVPPRLWRHPQVAPVAALTILVNVYMLDNLSNAFVNPLFAVVLGGVIAVLPAISTVTVQRRVRRVKSTVVASSTDAPPTVAEPQHG